MKKNEKNIRQKPNERYPEPGVPAGRAWADMQNMLDAEMPKAQATPKTWSLKSLTIISAAILTLAGIAVWLVIENGLVPENANKTSAFSERTVETENKQNSISIRETEAVRNIDSTTEGIGKDGEINTGFRNPEPTLPTDSKALNYKKINDNGPATDNSNDLPKNGIPPLHTTKELSAISQDAGSRQKLTDLTSEKLSKPEVRKNARALIQAKDQAGKRTGSLNEVNIRQQNIDQNLKEKTSFVPRSAEGQIVKNNEPARNWLSVNFLNKKEGSFEKKSGSLAFPLLTESESTKLHQKNKTRISDFLKGINMGLDWQGSIPFKYPDQYFTGTNNTNQFYMFLIPGIWAEKQFNRGNAILVKARAYNQYLGNHQQMATITNRKSDSVTTTTRVSLIKVSGFNAGLRYTQELYRNWHGGIGFDVQWQQRALISKSVNFLKNDSITVDSISYFGIKQTSNDAKYLNSILMTGSAEIFYSWKNVRLGGAINVPVNSMTSNRAERKTRPVSGSVFLRWRIK